MSFLSEIGRRSLPVIPQVLGLALLGYFALHLVQGDRGLRAYTHLSEKLKEAEAEERILMEDLEQAQARVAGLRPQSLDPDLLEERAHAVLNFAREDEVMVILPNSPAEGWHYRSAE